MKQSHESAPFLVPCSIKLLPLSGNSQKTQAGRLLTDVSIFKKPISCRKHPACVSMRYETITMRVISKSLLLLAQLTIVANLALAETRNMASYFRSDVGVARTNTGP